MTSRPEVSVVIPTFNRATLLPRALRMALSQEGVDLEVVVVDDHSTDETRRYLDQLAEPRVRVVRNERNLGVSRSRNRGIAAARAPWIAFLDDDDLWAPQKLRRQLERVREEDADFTYTRYIILGEGEECGTLQGVGVDPSDLAEHLLHQNEIGIPSSVLAARELIERTGGFDEQLEYMADWELWIRFVRYGRAALTPEVLVGYVRHPGNMIMRGSCDLDAELAYLKKKHPEVRTDGVVLTRWMGAAQRRAGRRGDAARIYWRGAVANRNPGNALRAVAVLLVGRAMGVVGITRKPADLYCPEWLDQPGRVSDPGS